jgi:hypothetical protein
MKNKIVLAGVMGAILGAGVADAAVVQKEVATVGFVRGGVASAKAYADTVSAGKQTASPVANSGKVLIGGAAAGTFGTARGIDNTPGGTNNSTDLITSGAVRSEMDQKENIISGATTDDGKVMTWDASMKQWTWRESSGSDSRKADKFVPTNAGNVATLDASGNLSDSGFGITLSSDTYSE